MKRLTLRLKNAVPDKKDLSSGAQDELSKAQIMEAVLCGLDIKEAAKINGVTDYKLGLFRSDPNFEELLQACQANAELEHLKNIAGAGKLGQWQASAWFLERKYPDKYGKKDTIRHEYEVKLGTFMRVVLEIVNTQAPELKKTILQNLRGVNVEELVYDAKRKEIEFKAAANDN
jgi:hypothetical protein